MQSSQTIKWVSLAFGLILLLFGILGVGLGILDILDPVGTKMADDGDPFGTSHTVTQSLTFTAIFTVALLSGLSLIFVYYKRRLK
ncbi:MAG TPA: hypothetical protein PKY82_02280 [Pyrinomonadaceae bacterium]|nr:hypothetical protein [Pyrinomonadaceae bacterium]